MFSHASTNTEASRTAIVIFLVFHVRYIFSINYCEKIIHNLDRICRYEFLNRIIENWGVERSNYRLMHSLLSHEEEGLAFILRS